jgi:hypothetical protein
VEDNVTVSAESQLKRTLMLVGVIVLVGLIVLTYHLSHKQKIGLSYQAAVANFNSAMGNGNASEVLSLESPAFKAALIKGTTAEKKSAPQSSVPITDNIYNISKADGDLVVFTPSFLSGAKIVTKDYKAANGVAGEGESFDTKTNYYGAPAYSPSFTIDVIPSGKQWYVDYVSYYAAASKQ